MTSAIRPGGPCVGVFCSDRQMVDRLHRAMSPLAFNVSLYDSPKPKTGAPEFDCLVFCARNPSEVKRLRSFYTRHRAIPIIAVLSRDPSWAVALKDIRCAAIIWYSELEEEIRHALRLCQLHTPLGLLSALGDRSSLPLFLHKALIHAVESRTAVGSVMSLAEFCGCHPSTLHRQWSEETGRHGGLKHFLDWLLLIRAAELKHPGLSWRGVARKLGSTEQTLRRTANRVLGGGLRTLARYTPERLRDHPGWREQLSDILGAGTPNRE